MKKSIQQYFGNVNANYVYEAKFNYQIEDVVRVFKDNINRRHDLTDEVKKAALAMPIGRDYELVYYPTYFYDTDTEKSWNTTSTRETSTTITTTTYHHTSSGHKGRSALRVKTDHQELDVLNVNLDTCGKVSNFGSLTLGVYEKGLFYSSSENKKNGIEEGRKASGATKDQSTYTIYTIYIVIVPILRYQFEINGKTYLFEMNLHNGSFVTSYKQKVICSIAKVVFNVVHKVLTIGAFLLPIISAISRLINGGFSSNGWGKILLGILGLIACVIAGFVSFGAFSGKRKFTFERIFYEPKTIVKVFVWPFVVFMIILTLTLVCSNAVFA